MEAPARDGTLRLLPASPPDIIRGVQKDDIYSNQLHDGCQDLAQRVLGVFPALQYEREVRLLAQLLYHGVTTGAGLQTLGEEYCNMMQVTRDGQLLSRQHRSTLVLLQSLGPYLAESVFRQLDAYNVSGSNATFGDGGAQHDSNTVLGEGGAQHDSNTVLGEGGAQHDSNTVLGEGGAQHDSNTVLGEGGAQHDSNTVLGEGGAQHDSNAGVSEHSSPQQARQDSGNVRDDTSTAVQGWGAGVRAWAVLRAWRARQWLASKWGPTLAAVSRPLAMYGPRLHLALFYLGGMYYQLPLRLAGVRFASIAQPLQQRTSYWTLGAILMCHLALTAVLQLRKAALQASGQLLEEGNSITGILPHAKLFEGGELGQSDETLKQGKPGILDKGNDESSGSDAMPVQPQIPHSSRQCPLCLSARTCPTSTPCGHVFCWACVAQWCGEKPECPLCRTRTKQAQLVPLYHSSLF